MSLNLELYIKAYKGGIAWNYEHMVLENRK